MEGATRFYPDSKIKSDDQGQYQNSVDVYLPRGWALVFRQKGPVHAGQPSVSVKYIAQAGILRRLPPQKLIQPSVFRLGPGLEAVRDNASEEAIQQMRGVAVGGARNNN